MRLGDRDEDFRRGGDHADLPAGQRKYLARRLNAHGAVAHARQGDHRDMRHAVKGEMLVHFITDGEGIVFEAQRRDEFEFVAAEYLGAGIHRRVDEDQLGLFGKRRFQFRPRQLPARRFQAHQFRNAAAALDDRQVGIVKRLDQDYLVAGLDQPEQRRAEGFGAARRHHGFRLPVDVEAVKPVRVLGDRHAEVGNAEHRRILVHAVPQVIDAGFDNVVGAVPVGEPLPQVDGVVFLRKARHDFENRGPVAGQNAVTGFHVGFLLLTAGLLAQGQTIAPAPPVDRRGIRGPDCSGSHRRRTICPGF